MRNLVKLFVVTICIFTLISCVATNSKNNTMRVTAKNILKKSVRGDIEGVRFILDRKPDLIHAKDKRGRTPLLLSVRPGQDGMYRVFMEYDAVVKLLISRGADVNVTMKNGGTALHLASSYKTLSGSNKLNGKPLAQHLQETQLRIVSYLLEAGANPNAKTNNTVHNDITSGGITPLHSAASTNHPSIVKLLISHGANVNARLKGGIVNDGATPLHLLCSVKILKNNTSQSQNAGEAQLQIVHYLLKAGSNVNARTSRGNTPLHYAALASNLELIKLLVSNGADINSKNNAGQTVFDAAKIGGNEGIKQFLSNQ